MFPRAARPCISPLAALRPQRSCLRAVSPEALRVSRGLWMVVLAAFLPLAGCVSTPTGPTPSFSWCPDWVQGPGQTKASLHLDTASPRANVTFWPPAANLNATANATGRSGPGWMHQGHPVDLYRIHLDALNLTAQLELQGSPADHPDQVIFARDNRVNTTLRLRSFIPLDASAVGQDFDFPLGSVAHNETAPGPFTARWTLKYDPDAKYFAAVKADITYTVTYWYRVCGA